MKERLDKEVASKDKETKDIVEDNNPVSFGEVAHKRLGITTQVASFYLDGLATYPNLGEGLTVERGASIHSWTMPKKDADEFVRRVEEHRKKVLG